MKINLYTHNQVWSIEWLRAFQAGLCRHGINADILSTMNIKSCDLAVFWSHRHTKIINYQKAHGNDYLTLERGYIGDRTKYTAMCFNGLNGKADWSHCEKSLSDRFNKNHAGAMRDYSINASGSWLLIGQVQGDASLDGININKWYHKTIEKIKAISDARIVFRQHPVELERKKARKKFEGVESSNRSLAEDLAGAMCVVTMNSNSGVESTFAGIPTITSDKMAMAYPVTSHEIENGFKVFYRDQWAYDLAYKQWMLDEMRSGEAWEHAKRRYQI
jgi:hypothetical protein